VNAQKPAASASGPEGWDEEELAAPMARRDGARELSSGVKPLLVLGKIRGILDSFTLSRPELTLSEIRAATGYPTSTVQRLVANLVAEEFLDREGDRVRIGVKFAYWAAPATRGLDELEIIKPVLEGLRDLTGETVALFRLEENVRVCVAMAETRHALRREMHVGKLLPLHAGSAGRVLLAWNPDAEAAVLSSTLERLTEHTITDPDQLRSDVDQTRRDGYAITSDERDEGATGLAAPVFTSMGDLAGALSVSGPSLRVTAEKCQAWIEPLVAAAEQATRLIGGRLPR
jgi:DNA-binding IclR family transcriptional regulator